MLFTRNGAQVTIVRSYKNYADCGVFLVQAQIVKASLVQTIRHEEVGGIVEANDPYTQGWIPAHQIISDTGTVELLRECLAAPDGLPLNVTSLCRMYWPAIFGYMQTEDIQARVSDSSFEGTGNRHPVLARLGRGVVHAS